MRLALGTGNPGWSRMWPELVCWEAWWLCSNEQEVVPASKMWELLAACAKDKLEFKFFFKPWIQLMFEVFEDVDLNVILNNFIKILEKL